MREGVGRSPMHRLIYWLALATVASLLGVFLVVAFIEYYLYFTKNEHDAEIAATSVFKRICIQHGFDPHVFHGPTRPDVNSDKKLGIYQFEWTMDTSKVISVSVVYLPYDLPYSISVGLIENEAGQKK
jgi:hypothetical protein